MTTEDDSITGEMLVNAYKSAVLQLIQNPEEPIAIMTAGHYWTDPATENPRRGIEITVTATRGALRIEKPEAEKPLIIV